jgi:hypothetical protein
MPAPIALVRVFRSGLALATVGVVVAGAAFALRNSYVVPPFAVVGVYLFWALLFGFARAGRGRWALYNLAFIVLFLTIGEIALFYSPIDDWKEITYRGTYTQHHFTPLPELGYGSIREKRVTTSQKYVAGKLVYDVKYTMDENGLRTTARHAVRDGLPVLFLGCSFTFGEGVDDAETLPASFEAITGRAAVNFGFHGYGPHQVLRELEIGLPRQFGYTQADMVIYTLLPAHVDRSAGRSPWDPDGPKYRIVDGQLKYEGPFSKGNENRGAGMQSDGWRPVRRVLDRSAIYRLWANHFGELRTEEEDRRTAMAIVAEADRLVRSQYGTPMTILLWDVGPNYPKPMRERAEYFKQEAARRSLRLIALSEYAPQLNDARYYYPTEGHPTAAAYMEAAQALAQWARGQ